MRRYEKTRPRNEALDLEVYALAALASLGTPVLQNLGGYVEQVRREGEKVRAERSGESSEPKPEAQTGKRALPRQRGGWVQRWR